MQAFHNDIAIKAKYIARVLAHAEADQIIHGKYWEHGKGCAVGCTIHGSDHMAYEREGIAPVMLARLEDSLFEGMTNGRAKQFPLQFLSAIKVGADLSLVGWKFLHWLLTEELVGRDDPRVAAIIKRCADALAPLTKGDPADVDEVRTAAYAAYALNTYAAASAAGAASYAAYAAAYAAHALNAAAYAADAAYAASAASAAAYAANAAGAAGITRSEACERMADKLLALMWECEGQEPIVAMGVMI